MDNAAALEALEARLTRFIQVAETLWSIVWWFYLGTLLVMAYLNRETLGWDEIKFAAMATGALIAAMVVLTALILGALHAWRLSLIAGMLGGFTAQGWGCVAGVCPASVVGLIAIFFDTRPLREERRRRRFVRST